MEIAVNLSQPFSVNGAVFKIFSELRVKDLFSRTPVKKIILSAILLEEPASMFKAT